MLNIKADFDAAERLLSDLGRKQLPWATAMAINETAQQVKEAEEMGIASTFDRPTPYTKRGLYVRRASKSSLAATVGVKRIQSNYLKRQVTGGRRSAATGALVVPVSARLNKYGNIAKGALKRLTARKDVFVSGRGRSRVGHLPAGIYQRNRSGGSIKMLVAFESSANYRARWQFHEHAMRRARSVFEPAFFEALRRAIATAK